VSRRYTKVVLGVAAVSLLVPALAACAGDGSSTTPTIVATTVTPTLPPTMSPIIKGKVETTCTSGQSWSPLSAIRVDPDKVAMRLNVSIQRVKRGSFGPATCKALISQDRIASINPPVVTVAGRGKRCVVIGTQKPPVTGGTTKSVLAFCAADTDVQATA